MQESAYRRSKIGSFLYFSIFTAIGVLVFLMRLLKTDGVFAYTIKCLQKLFFYGKTRQRLLMKIELHDTFRILEPIYSSSFLCWPCNSCFSKHYFIDIFAYECGWQSYSWVILLRSVPRTVQILILNKNGSRAMISSRFNLLQGSVQIPILVPERLEPFIHIF